MIIRYEEFEKSNEGLNFFSVEHKPFLKLMKKIYEDQIYKRKLSDLEFKFFFVSNLEHSGAFSRDDILYDKKVVLENFIFYIVLHAFSTRDTKTEKIAINIIMNYDDRKNNFSEYKEAIDTTLNKLLERYYPYESFKKKLDDYAKNGDIDGFLKLYNSAKTLENWKERYLRERPENKDIIDGANIGMFGLKTNEGLNFFSVENKPFLKLMKRIYEDQIYKRKLSDIEFKIHLYSYLLNRKGTVIRSSNSLDKRNRVWLNFNNIIYYSFGSSVSTELIDKIIMNYGNDLKYSKYDNLYLKSIDKINAKYYPYESFKKKLDDFIKNGDIDGFLKLYNNTKSFYNPTPSGTVIENWKERYLRERPENKDIIDGANIGMFGLKTN